MVASAASSTGMETEAPDTDPIVREILTDADPDRARTRLRAELAGCTPAEGAALLERLAEAAADTQPARATRWLVEAAALWFSNAGGTAGDPKRAARALRAAVDVSPTDDEAVAQLTALYRDNGKHRPLARLLERRAEMLFEGAGEDQALLRHAAEAFTGLGDLFRAPPLSSQAEAIAAYGRAIATGAAPLEAFRAARALYVEAEQSADALPLFALERDRCTDPAALIALYRDEARARERAGDGAGASALLRLAHKVDPDARELAEELWRSVHDRLAAGKPVLPEERAEAAAILTAAARKLEATALPAQDLAGLKLAFALAVRALEGAPRAAELVRQAEVLIDLGAERPLAVRHAEPAVAELTPAEALPLLERLERVAGPDEAVALHERAVARAATPEGRALALTQAARVAVRHGLLDRLERFFVTVSVHAAEEPSLVALERAAAEGDHHRGGTVLRGILAAALARTEPDVIDGGRTRSALLRRAARIARRDLADPDQAFEWLGDALFARLEGALEEGLAPLEHLTLGAAPAPAVPPARPPTQPPPPPIAATLAPPPPVSAPPRVEVLSSRGQRLPPLAQFAGKPRTPPSAPPPSSVGAPSSAFTPAAPVPAPAPVPPPPAAPPPPSVRADAVPVARPPTIPPANPRFDAPPPPSVRADLQPIRPPPPAPPPPSVRAEATTPSPQAVPQAPPPPPPAPLARTEAAVHRPSAPPPPPPVPQHRPPTIPPTTLAARPPTVPPPPPPAPAAPPAAVAPAAPRPPVAPRPSTASSRRKIGKPPLTEMRDPFAPSRTAPTAPAAPAPNLGAPPEPRAPTPTPPSGSAARSRISGDELIADLFEAMHELDFCADSRDAAAFTLKLAMAKLGSDVGVVHLYDIDRREFVVVHAAGPGASVLRGLRTSDTDPLAAEAMRTRGAILVSAPAGDPRTSGQRWAAMRNAAGTSIASIAVSRAAQAGRFLGLVELCNLDVADPQTPGTFAAGDEHALTYMAERFGEFVAAHGVMLDDEG